MGHNFKYSTASEAISKLRELGFDKDFAVKDGFVWLGDEKYEAEDLRIEYTSRYEGHSDPGDEATVYGMETKDGLKGILVTGDGIYADKNTADLLQKLHRAKLSRYSDNLGE